MTNIVKTLKDLATLAALILEATEKVRKGEDKPDTEKKT